jgi:hypothetical protein
MYRSRPTGWHSWPLSRACVSRALRGEALPAVGL